MRRARRCVPPNPGITPRLISGCPNLAVSAATMRSQASASSMPPPSTKPFTAAMTGIGNSSSPRATPSPRAANFLPSSGDMDTMTEMSAPATNARPPAPVRIRQRTPSSARTVSRQAASSANVAGLSALRLLGRLTVRMPIAPSCSNDRLSYAISFSSVSSPVPALPMSRACEKGALRRRRAGRSVCCRSPSLSEGRKVEPCRIGRRAKEAGLLRLNTPGPP